MVVFFRSKKKLGQNFILSNEIIRKIVSLAGNLKDFNVIEIGPGYGALTKEILKNNPKFLLAIEKDGDLIKYHNKLLHLYYGKYKIIKADALHIKEEKLINKPVKIIANLPYNISLALFLKWLKNIKFFASLVLTFQKEVAERIIAKFNSKKYCSLSVISQLLCNIKKEFDIEPKNFFPRPKVNSSVIKVIPLSNQRFSVNSEVLIKLLNTVFLNRRKMLKNSLQKNIYKEKDIFKNAKLNGNERPENLTIEQFCLLANAIQRSF